MAKTKSKINEKLTLAISASALLVSLCTPFVTYKWLQIAVREQEIKQKGFEVSGEIGFSVVGGNDKFEYDVIVRNKGKLPIADIELSFRYYANELETPELSVVEINPPTLVQKDVTDQTLIILFENALPPAGEVKISLARNVRLDELNDMKIIDAWVSTEATPKIPIVWRGGSLSM